MASSCPFGLQTQALEDIIMSYSQYYFPPNLLDVGSARDYILQEEPLCPLFCGSFIGRMLTVVPVGLGGSGLYSLQFTSGNVVVHRQEAVHLKQANWLTIKDLGSFTETRCCTSEFSGIGPSAYFD